MTTLDRAFIKAFAEATSPAGGAEKPAVTARPERGAETPPLAAPPTDPLLHAAETTDAPLAPSPPLPLSSFAARSRVDDSFRALLEIDRAAFPEACGELLGRASRDWDRFAEQLIERMSRGQKCVALASIAQGDGCTTISLALAKHLAARGLRPVVVDADPENPTLVRSCGVSVHTGWDDLLASELPLGEALISAVEDGVTLMPWRGPAMVTRDLAAAPRTPAIFGALREHYDLVLLDTMPLVGSTTITDFAGFASAVRLDALYLIHNVRTTSRDQLTATCSKLRGAGVPLVAVIENFVSPAVPRDVASIDSAAAPGRKLAAHGS